MNPVARTAARNLAGGRASPGGQAAGPAAVRTSTAGAPPAAAADGAAPAAAAGARPLFLRSGGAPRAPGPFFQHVPDGVFEGERRDASQRAQNYRGKVRANKGFAADRLGAEEFPERRPLRRGDASEPYVGICKHDSRLGLECTVATPAPPNETPDIRPGLPFRCPR